MLFIDDKKVDRQKLADMFGVDLAKIEAQPSFELDKSQIKVDRANGNVPKVGNGISIRPKFRCTIPGTKQKAEIRYAQSQTPEKNSNGTSFDYKPRYVTNEGSKFSFLGDLDLGLFMFLYPGNTFSPCREAGRRYDNLYEFVDTKARAIKRLGAINAKTKALSHAERTDIFDLRIIAKGLNVPGVEKMDDDTVRVTMMEFADNPATTQKYIDAINSSTTKYDGRIVNLIDKGIIAIKKIGGNRQWYWVKGDREGEPIGNVIVNPQQDASKYIRNYMLSNLDVYGVEIMETTSTMSARAKADAYLSANDPQVSTVNGSPDFDTVKEVTGIRIGGVDLPDWNDWNAVRAFVEKKGYKKVPGDIKVLQVAGQEGHINEDNVDIFMEENMRKAED